MIENYKLVVVTPAGRRRYMKLLIPYVLRDENVDRYDIWVNTTNPLDLEFLNEISNLDKINLIEQPSGVVNGSSSICEFFQHAIDEDTIYIRIDDDIVWLEKDALSKIARFRIDNPEFFLVAPLIINNAVCTNILQNLNILDAPCLSKQERYVSAYVMDHTGWDNPEFAAMLHQWFLEILQNNELHKLRFEPVRVGLNRFSINCISWLGKEFRKFDGYVEENEEEYLTVVKPLDLRMINAIYGGTVLSHLAFYTQREQLDQSDLLTDYEQIARNEIGTTPVTTMIDNLIEKLALQESQDKLKTRQELRGPKWVTKFGSKIRRHFIGKRHN